MSIRAVIWDMGGVILRTEDHTFRTDLATRLGLDREGLERIVFDGEVSERATLGQIGVDELWQDICARLQLPPERLAELQQGFWGGDRLDTELVDYIRSLRPKYRSGLLSNAWLDMRQVLQERMHILDAFDEVIISAEVGLMKPDPRIFQLAVERLGAAPAEAVFIDDFPPNVRAAREFGLNAIRFRDPAQARAELEQLLANRQEFSILT